MAANAPDHSRPDLTLREGMDVVAFGRSERQGTSDAVILQPLHPWLPDRQGWSALGHVRVVAESAFPDVSKGAMVRVQGTWTGSFIDLATIETVADPTVITVPSPMDRIPLRDAGLERYLELCRAVDATPSPVISSGGGGPTDTAWFYVLYVTPELAELIEQTPLRASIQVAITPSL